MKHPLVDSLYAAMTTMQSRAMTSHAVTAIQCHFLGAFWLNGILFHKDEKVENISTM